MRCRVTVVWTTLLTHATGCTYFQDTAAPRCEDARPGAFSILTQGQCQEAAASIAASSSPAAVEEQLANWPYGCYVHRPENNKLYLNTDPLAFMGCDHGDAFCVCADADCATSPSPPTSAPATPSPPTHVTPSPPTHVTPSPPTSAPATPSPPNHVPPTPSPPTSAPATPSPPTHVPPTPSPPTSAPTTPSPPNHVPPTPSPPTSAPTTASPATPTPQTPSPPTPVPPEAQRSMMRMQETVTAVGQGATGLGAAAGFAGGNAGAGAAGLLVVVADATCHVEGRQHWPRTLHPTQITVAGDMAAGAVVGNLAMCAAVAVVLFIATELCEALRCFGWLERNRDIKALLKFPSGPLVVYLLVYPGSMLAAVVVIVDHTGDFAVCGLVGAMVVCAVPFMVHREVVSAVPPEGSGGQAYYLADDRAYAKWAIRMIGPGEWVSTAPSCHWVRRWQAVLRPWTQRRAYWTSMEALLTAFVALCKGYNNTGHWNKCAGDHLAAAVAYLVLAAAELKARPHAVERDMVLVGLHRVITACALLCLSAGFYIRDRDSEWFNAASTLFIIAGALLGVKFVLDLANEAYVFWSGRRNRLQEVAWRGTSGDGDALVYRPPESEWPTVLLSDIHDVDEEVEMTRTFVPETSDGFKMQVVDSAELEATNPRNRGKGVRRALRKKQRPRGSTFTSPPKRETSLDALGRMPAHPGALRRHRAVSADHLPQPPSRCSTPLHEKDPLQGRRSPYLTPEMGPIAPAGAGSFDTNVSDGPHVRRATPDAYRPVRSREGSPENDMGRPRSRSSSRPDVPGGDGDAGTKVFDTAPRVKRSTLMDEDLCSTLASLEFTKTTSRT